MEKKFNQEGLKEFFEALDFVLDKKVTIYLVGGGSMCLRGIKAFTKDVDFVLMNEKDYNTARKISKELGKKFHIIIILFKNLYTEPIWKTLISEGYSIKKNKFLRDIVHVKAVEVFSYKINKMNPTEKTQFNRGFNNVLEETKGFKIGAGSVIIPEEKSGKFFDFFSRWDKAKNKTYKALLI